MSGSERLVTDHVLAFRECARTGWNGFFRHLPDGWHEFIDVERALYAGLVRVQAFDGVGPTGREVIHVRPHFGADGLEVFWARGQQEGRYWSWQPRRLRACSISLSFLEFFDWDRDGIRDFQFLRARVEACADDASLEGGDLLVPALCAECFVVVDG